jgi:hypothetical protein
MHPKLKPPGTQRLKLKGDMLLSTSALKFNLRRYIEGQKRKLALEGNQDSIASKKRALKADMEHARWLHVARLPLTVTAADVRAAVAGVKTGKEKGKVAAAAAAWVSAANGGGAVEWIPDKETGFFYGSAYVEMPTVGRCRLPLSNPR